MTDNLFDQTDEQKDYLALLVGENAKFKTTQDLAKGKYISDEYIKTLERQLDDYRSELVKEREENNSRAKIDELYDLLKKPQLPSDQPDATVVPKQQTPVIDQNAINNAIASALKEHEENKKYVNNFDLVKSKLVERFGNDYPNQLRKVQEDLELSDEELNNLARTKPKMLFAALGMDKPQPREGFMSPPRNERTGFTPTSKQVRNMKYYESLKKENPKLYLDPDTNIQMHKDAMAQGDAFFDGYED